MFWSFHPPFSLSNLKSRHKLNFLAPPCNRRFRHYKATLIENFDGTFTVVKWVKCSFSQEDMYISLCNLKLKQRPKKSSPCYLLGSWNFDLYPLQLVDWTYLDLSPFGPSVLELGQNLAKITMSLEQLVRFSWILDCRFVLDSNHHLKGKLKTLKQGLLWYKVSMAQRWQCRIQSKHL